MRAPAQQNNKKRRRKPRAHGIRAPPAARNKFLPTPRGAPRSRLRPAVRCGSAEREKEREAETTKRGSLRGAHGRSTELDATCVACPLRPPRTRRRRVKAGGSGVRCEEGRDETHGTTSARWREVAGRGLFKSTRTARSPRAPRASHQTPHSRGASRVRRLGNLRAAEEGSLSSRGVQGKTHDNEREQTAPAHHIPRALLGCGGESRQIVRPTGARAAQVSTVASHVDEGSLRAEGRANRRHKTTNDLRCRENTTTTKPDRRETKTL